MPHTITLTRWQWPNLINLLVSKLRQLELYDFHDPLGEPDGSFGRRCRKAFDRIDSLLSSTDTPTRQKLNQLAAWFRSQGYECQDRRSLRRVMFDFLNELPAGSHLTPEEALDGIIDVLRAVTPIDGLKSDSRAPEGGKAREALLWLRGNSSKMSPEQKAEMQRAFKAFGCNSDNVTPGQPWGEDEETAIDEALELCNVVEGPWSVGPT